MFGFNLLKIKLLLVKQKVYYFTELYSMFCTCTRKSDWWYFAKSTWSGLLFFNCCKYIYIDRHIGVFIFNRDTLKSQGFCKASWNMGVWIKVLVVYFRFSVGLLNLILKLKLLSVGHCYWDVLAFNTVFINIVPIHNALYNWFLSVFFVINLLLW